MNRAAPVLLALLIAGAAGPATADGSLDVRGWLDRPGVRLLAVEFYATWCKPCMDAVPRWKALHEKYRAEGLRFVVVATRDPSGGCANPGWNPDEVVCDEDGAIADALGAGDRLPSAFLWSWQGPRLVQGGHVDDVEKAIETWMRTAPRVQFGKVDVDEASEVDTASLQAMLRAEVDRTGKVTFVATDDERARLTRVVEDSMRVWNDERFECKAGQQLSANSLLEVSIVGAGERMRLRLALMSAERGCQVSAATVEWSAAKSTASVAEAVAELLARLRADPVVSNAGATIQSAGRVRRSKDKIDFGGGVKNERPGERGFLVVKAKTAAVEGDAGDAGRYVAATVYVDNATPVGTTRGDRGWSSAAPLVAGTHRVTVTYQDEDWMPAQSSVLIVDGDTTEVELELQPRFGLLDVTSEPAGARVEVNGRSAAGLTPLKGLRVPAGEVDVQITAEDYVPAYERVRVVAAKVIALNRALEANFGTLVITSEPSGAAVTVDGTPSGNAPVTLERQATGRHEIALELAGHAPAGVVRAAERGKSTVVEVRLEPYLGRLLVTSLLRTTEGASECRALATVSRGGGALATKPTPAEFRDLLAVEHEVSIDCAGVYERRTTLVEHNKDVTVAFIIDDERLASVTAWRWRKWISLGLAVAAGAVGTERLFAAQRAESERDTALTGLANATTASEFDSLRAQVVDQESARGTAQVVGFSVLGGAAALLVWSTIEWVWGEPDAGDADDADSAVADPFSAVPVHR